MIEITQKNYRAKTKKTVHRWLTALCLTAALWLCAVGQVSAAPVTRTASVSGAWTSTATWGGTGVPVATDIVIINAGVTVTGGPSGSMTLGTLQLDGTWNASGSKATFSNATVNGTLTITASSFDVVAAGTLTVNNGGNVNFDYSSSFGLTGGLTVNAGGTFKMLQNKITVAKATTCNGLIDLIASSSANTFTGAVSGTGTIKTGVTAVTFTAAASSSTFLQVGGGTLTYKNPGSNVTLPTTVNNLTIEGNSSTKTFSTTEVFGDLNVSVLPAESVVLSGNITVDGNLNINTGKLDLKTYNVIAKGDLTNNGTVLGTTGQIQFAKVGIQQLSGTGAIAGVSVATNAIVNIGTGLNIAVNNLTLGGLGKINGTWGSTLAGKTNVNDTFFASTTGYLTVTNDTRIITTINPSPTTASAIIYGQTLASSTLSSDGVGSVAGSFAFTSPTLVPNAGTANQGVTFTPTNIADYKPATTTVSVTVSKKDLTVNNAVVTPKVYDGLNTAAITGATLQGKVGSDDVSLANGAPTFASVNVANGIAVTPDFSLTGTAIGNYTLTQPSLSAADITAAPLTVTAGNQTVAFGAAATAVTAAGTSIITGFVNGENATSAGLTGAASYTTSYTDTTAAGTTGVTITPAVGTLAAANYSFGPFVNGTVTITTPVVKGSSTISVTGLNSFTNNGSPQGPATATVTGSTGAVTYLYTNTDSVAYSSATPPTNVGAYQVVATVATDANFDAATSAPFPFSIIAATANTPVINSSLTASSIYDTTAPVYTITASNTPTSFSTTGLPNGLSLDAGTGVITGTATDVPGDYNVTISATNVDGTGTATLVYTIQKKNLSVSGASVTSKVYDGTNAATITGAALVGVATADIATVALSGNGTFNDVNVSTAVPVTTAYTLSGTAAAKYTLTQPTGLSADIIKADQTITLASTDSKISNVADYSPATSATSAVNAITYVSDNTAVATIVSGKVHLVAAGTTHITASQAGSANYNAAADAIQTLTVTAPVVVVKKVLYVTKGTVGAAYDDATVRMLRSENFDVTTNVTDATGTGLPALSGFDLLVIQESFGSGDAVLKPGGKLELAKLIIPVIYNKTFAFKKAGNLSSTTTTSVGKDVTDLTATIVQGSPIFNGITSTSVPLLKVTVGSKSINYATPLTIAGGLTLLATPTSVASASTTVFINDIPANTQLGDIATDKSPSEMITFGFNSAALLSGDGKNLTDEYLTIWRNAAYYLTGQTAPSTLYINPDNHQTITFNAIPAITYGDALTLTATSKSTATSGSNVGTAGAPVTYVSSDTSVATVDAAGVVTTLKPGTTTITASAGTGTGATAYWYPAADVAQTLTVGVKALTISNAAATSKTYDGTTAVVITGTLTGKVGADDVVLVGTGSFADANADTGKAVTFNYTLTGADIAKYTLTQPTALTADINKVIPVLAVANPTVAYTGSAQSAVVNVTNSVAGIVNVLTGGAATQTAGGIYAVTADFIPTDAVNYATLTGVSVGNFEITKLAQTITFGALTAKTYGDAAFNLSATASSGLTVTYSSSNTNIATVNASGLVTIVAAGSVNITASQAGDAGYSAASDVLQVLNIAKATQTITFGVLANKLVGDAAITLPATASSGLAIIYTSSNPNVVTVSGNVLTIVGAGPVTITASQAGDAGYAAASDVTRSFDVSTPLATADFNAGSSIVVYSNGNEVFVSNVKSNTTVSVYSLSGALVKTVETSSDASFNLGSGVWVARVKSAEGEKSVKLLVK